MFVTVVAVLLSAGLLYSTATFVLRREHDIRQAISLHTMPDVSVAARRGAIPDSIAYEQQYNFTQDWFTPNIPVWKEALAEFKGRPNIHYLEIGVFEGRSAIWMLENILTEATARLTAVDRFEGSLKERWSANVDLSGASSKVTTLTGYSQLVLRDLPLGSFDIVYIDGSHYRDDVLEDPVLSWRLLKEDGVLIFDDYDYVSVDSPKLAIDRFYECFGKHFDVVHKSYQVIMRKKRRKTQ
jgi:hypothetical protein